jgi:hypothetical protein
MAALVKPKPNASASPILFQMSGCRMHSSRGGPGHRCNDNRFDHNLISQQAPSSDILFGSHFLFHTVMNAPYH